MQSVVLSRDQIFKISQVLDDNPDINEILVEIDNSNGIGPVIKVKYTAEVDITEVDKW